MGRNISVGRYYINWDAIENRKLGKCCDPLQSTRSNRFNCHYYLSSHYLLGQERGGIWGKSGLNAKPQALHFEGIKPRFLAVVFSPFTALNITPFRLLSTIPGCSKPSPIWLWTLPGMGHPKLLWVTCAMASPPSQQTESAVKRGTALARQERALVSLFLSDKQHSP